MRKFLTLSTLCVAMFGAASVASAARLEIIGSPTVREIPNNFNPGPSGAIGAINTFISHGAVGSLNVLSDFDTDVSVFSGSAKNASNGLAIDFEGASSVDITFTYFGKEAAFTNLALAINGGTTTLFNNTTSSIGDTATLTFTSTGNSGSFFIPFIFQTNRGTSNTSDDLRIANDGGATKVSTGDPVNNLEIGFLQDLNGDLFTNDLGVVEGSTVAFFGDGTGDTDLDDMVIGIGITSITAVPLPAPVLLLLTALGGLGVMSRIKRRLA